MKTLFNELAETRTVLRNVSWGTFVALSEERDGSVPRMTYDDGILEMMNPLRKHENLGCLIGRMVEAYSEVQGIEILSVASVTVKRRDLNKGFEADESYYVTHAVELLDREELDFEVDPVPDLVIEVELTASAIKKMQLFAAMKVPEVWRHDGSSLKIYRLNDGQYQLQPSSIELPGLTALMMNETLSKRLLVGETTLIRQFRSSVQG
ncbi:MAG: Uma2 family endonuclease [Pirellula sp.]